MSRTEVVSRLRGALSARDERDRALPRALCRVCGGWAHKGEGTRRPEPEFVSAHDRAERNHWLSRQPADTDGWRRTCAVCVRAETEKRAASAILAALIGPHDLTEHEANGVLRVLVLPDPDGPGFIGGATAEAAERATGKPWEHVTEADRERLREAWADLIAARSARPSSLGGCGMCGRAEAVGDWWQAPDSLRWPNGAAAALCASCAKVWKRRGEPFDIESLRRVGVEAATGWPVPLGDSAPASFRLFAESRAADPEGLESPWSWSDGLRAFIERTWTWHPEHASEERRDEFVQRRREAIDAMAAEDHAKRIHQEAVTW